MHISQGGREGEGEGEEEGEGEREREGEGGREGEGEGERETLATTTMHLLPKTLVMDTCMTSAPLPPSLLTPNSTMHNSFALMPAVYTLSVYRTLP